MLRFLNDVVADQAKNPMISTFSFYPLRFYKFFENKSFITSVEVQEFCRYANT